MTDAPRRRLRYQVASSLDGFIATEDGGYDWIPMDPEIDFGALFAQFDTLVMGRKTYEMMQALRGRDRRRRACTARRRWCSRGRSRRPTTHACRSSPTTRRASSRG